MRAAQVQFPSSEKNGDRSMLIAELFRGSLVFFNKYWNNLSFG